MTEKKSVFETLSAVNVNSLTEKKNGLTYLSWAHAWAEVKKRYPSASYGVVKHRNVEGVEKPYLYDPLLGYLVETYVDIDGDNIPMHLFVMDGANKPKKADPYTYKKKKWVNGNTTFYDETVEAADMFDINTTIMRCLAKNLAMHGLGIYIYQGEDLPQTQDGEPTPPTAAEKPKATAPSTASWITDAQVATAIKKIETGEDGIMEEVLAKYKVSKANRAKLEAAKPKSIDSTPDDSTKQTKEVAKTRKPRNSAQKEEDAATVPTLDPKAEAIDDKGNIRPNDAFVEELMNERQQKALKFFETFQGPDWIRVSAYSKVALKSKPDVAAIAFACKDAQELVTKLSIEDALSIATAIKEAEDKKKKEESK